MGDPRELEWAKKPDALKESWTARIGTHVYTEFPLHRLHYGGDKLQLPLSGLSGLVTNEITHPSPASFGLLEEVPSAGRRRNKIVSLSQQLKLSMLPSHVLFKKESGSNSLLINSESTALALLSFLLTSMVLSPSQSMTPTMAKPSTSTFTITSFTLISNLGLLLLNTLPVMSQLIG